MLVEPAGLVNTGDAEPNDRTTTGALDLIDWSPVQGVGEGSGGSDPAESTSGDSAGEAGAIDSFGSAFMVAEGSSRSNASGPRIA